MVDTNFHPFRSVPRTGVIFVSEEAAKCGFKPGDSKWCNLGQGQPESGPLPGAPPRPTSLPMNEVDFEYAPVGGLRDLREAVAHLYNTIYRKGSASQYTLDNVAIAGGGRVALTRVLSAIGQVNVGHFLPDYTAYEELLDVFRAFHPTPIML
ncbi:MAG: pyridoxal phosphate-dependent aminotransferase, partial [Clostridia bacterium]|nr:pyridoxal phosphate-dependent aminotransferase [Deltaproteobacteria bacterium]